jgi:hypothetical protein
VDAAVHEKIARDAEKDHTVQTPKHEVVVEQIVDPAEGCIEQPAGCNEDEPAMKLGLPAPVDGEAETDGKGGHVKERDEQKRVRARQVQLDGIEAPHHDGRCRAEENHAGPERGAEPAQRAVPAHTVRADQRGLENEENNFKTEMAVQGGNTQFAKAVNTLP